MPTGVVIVPIPHCERRELGVGRQVPVVEHRVDEDLPGQLHSPVPGRDADSRCHTPSSTVPDDGNPLGIDSEVVRPLDEPGEHREAILGRCRTRVLRRVPVVDRQDGHAGLADVVRHESVVEVDGSCDHPSAVEVHQRRPRSLALIPAGKDLGAIRGRYPKVAPVDLRVEWKQSLGRGEALMRGFAQCRDVVPGGQRHAVHAGEERGDLTVERESHDQVLSPSRYLWHYVP